MKVFESELPGIGKKYSVLTSNGDSITVIIHHSGKREIYFVPEGEDEPESVVELTDEEARTLGTILVGALFQPTSDEEKIAFLLKHLAFEWLKVGKKSPVVNKSIQELQIRKNFGVIVVAVMRKNEVFVSPSPSFKFLPGDTLIVVGSIGNIKNFVKFCKKE